MKFGLVALDAGDAMLGGAELLVEGERLAPEAERRPRFLDWRLSADGEQRKHRGGFLAHGVALARDLSAAVGEIGLLLAEAAKVALAVAGLLEARLALTQRIAQFGHAHGILAGRRQAEIGAQPGIILALAARLLALARGLGRLLARRLAGDADRLRLAQQGNGAIIRRRREAACRPQLPPGRAGAFVPRIGLGQARLRGVDADLQRGDVALGAREVGEAFGLAQALIGQQIGSTERTVEPQGGGAVARRRAALQQHQRAHRGP